MAENKSQPVGVVRGKYLLMFRKMVRKVILQKFWQSFFDSHLDPNLIRNTTTVFRRKFHKEILFQREKQILSIPFDQRDAVQKKIAELIIARLRFMDIFDPDLRRKLSSSLRYVQYCKGRTVIKERYESNVLYFILSGEINMTTMKSKAPLSILGPGDIFGQLGLINEELRRNTYETATACELLYLLKEDFDVVLKPKLKSKLSDIRTALGRFSYFNNWTEAQLEECTILAKIANYQPEEVIYSEDRGLLNYVFFVLHGRCDIIQYLRILKTARNRFKLEPIAPSSRKTSNTPSIAENDNLNGNLIRHFVTVGQYGSGSIFGLGEELQDRLIIAKQDVQCLLLPRYFLFQKEQNMSNIWNRTKTFLDANLPSREGLFREFLINRRWKSYKQQLIERTPHRTVHQTTHRNIPIICRIENGL